IIVDNSLTLPFKSLTLEFKVLVSLLFKSKLLSSFLKRVLFSSLFSVIFSFIFLTSSLILVFILLSDFSKSSFVASSRFFFSSTEQILLHQHIRITFHSGLYSDLE